MRHHPLRDRLTFVALINSGDFLSLIRTRITEGNVCNSSKLSARDDNQKFTIRDNRFF